MVLVATILPNRQVQAHRIISPEQMYGTIAAFYKELVKSGEIIVVVHGQLTIDKSSSRSTDAQNHGKTARRRSSTVSIEGMMLSKRGFDTPFNDKASCSDYSCERIEKGVDHLYFLRKVKDGFQLHDEYVVRSTPQRLNLIAQCFRGESCSKYGIDGSVTHLPSDVIKLIVRIRADDYPKCYQKQLKVEPTLKGKIEIEVELSNYGHILSSKVSSSTMKSPKLENCIRDNVSKLLFPKPINLKKFSFRFPFLFEPKGKMISFEGNLSSQKSRSVRKGKSRLSH